MKGGGGDAERLPMIMGTPGAVQGAKLQASYRHLFAEEEVVEIGFKTPGEMFIFTDRRMILAQRLGLMGKQGECHSFPYSNIRRLSVENVGVLDSKSELQVWVLDEEVPLRRTLKKKVSYAIHQLLSRHIK